MSAREAETALQGPERPKKRVGLLFILLLMIFLAAVAAIVHRRITDLDRTRGDITHKIVETAESLLAMGAHVEGEDCDVDFKGGEFVLVFVALFLYEFMYMPLNGKYTIRT